MPNIRLVVLIALSLLSAARQGLADEPTPPDPPLHVAIDRQISASFARWSVRAAPLATDEEFLRRVTLDLTGVIPQAKTARAFLADSDANKREKAIDRLLASDEHAQHLANVFDVMLMERLPDKNVPAAQWHDYLRSSFAANKPLHTLVGEILGSDGTDPQLRPAAKFALDRGVDHDLLVRDIGRLFLGVNLQCAQCHDHPTIADYSHQDYFGLKAFVAGWKTFKQPGGELVLQEMVVDKLSFASVFAPDASRTTGPHLLDGPVFEVPGIKAGEEYVEKPSSKVRAVPRQSLRQKLAESLPSVETVAFSRNMANRLWSLMMGRGLVDPLDMHHSDNPPSHPELLTLVSQRFAATRFDVRAFLRELALSETYQRSSLAPEGTAPDSVPPESFAVANLKGLGPATLFHSLLRASQNERALEQELDAALRADAKKYEMLQADPALLVTARAAQRAERQAQFNELFGATPGSPEGEFQASLPQALFLANNEIIAGWVKPHDGNLTEHLLSLKTDEADKIAEEAYLHILSRFPTAEEAAKVEEHLANGDDRPVAMMELVWSLLASAEFRLNH